MLLCVESNGSHRHRRTALLFLYVLIYSRTAHDWAKVIRVNDQAITPDSAARRGLRRALRKLRAAIPLAQRRAAARAAARTLSRCLWLRPGARVALYVSTPEEFDTRDIMRLAARRGWRVFLPRIDNYRMHRMLLAPLSERFHRNRYATPEPATRRHLSARWFQLIVVPAVGFDRAGHRLGMGAGYYDRLLAFRRRRTSATPPRVYALAFACQQTEALRAQPHDVQLDGILTEKGWKLR